MQIPNPYQNPRWEILPNSLKDDQYWDYWAFPSGEEGG